MNEAHEDGCFATFIAATTSGLEIQDTSGAFIPVLPTPDKLLIIPGDILSLLSGGTIRPALHRVARHADTPDRMSLLFFADLEPSRCRPWISNDINADIDFAERIRTNPLRFGLSEWCVDD